MTKLKNLNFLQQIDNFLITANGKICCKRCLARSVRTGIQCARPALKHSKNQKCQFHGGAPLSERARQLIVEANLKHGKRSKGSISNDREAAILQRELVDAVNVLEIGQAKRLIGRRPTGYVPIEDRAGVMRLVNEKLIHMMYSGDKR